MVTYEFLLDRKNNNLPVVPERIVCAANLLTCGITLLGARHGDEAMQHVYDNLSNEWITRKGEIQGFYTSWQRFVTQEEAMIIAREQGQLFRPDGTHNPDVLYSECLY